MKVNKSAQADNMSKNRRTGRAPGLRTDGLGKIQRTCQEYTGFRLRPVMALGN